MVQCYKISVRDSRTLKISQIFRGFVRFFPGLSKKIFEMFNTFSLLAFRDFLACVPDHLKRKVSIYFSFKLFETQANIFEILEIFKDFGGCARFLRILQDFKDFARF